MATLAAIPILILTVMIQTSIVSRVPLLLGTADLILLVTTAWALQERVRTAWQWCLLGGIFIGYVSALPMWIPIVSYMVATALALSLRRRIWQIPIFAMFIVIFVGTLVIHTITAIVVSISGATIPLLETLNLIILPSLILNLFLAVPAYAVIKDLAEWIYPEEIEI